MDRSPVPLSPLPRRLRPHHNITAQTLRQTRPVRELTRQVESELLKELDAAGIFSRITRFDQNHDVILSGRISALHEYYRPQTWAKIPDFFPYVGMIAQLLRPSNVFRDIPSISGDYLGGGTRLRPYIGAGFGSGYAADLDRSLSAFLL
jgi:hypothetical protein